MTVFSGLTVPEAAAIAEITYELERGLTIAGRIWRRVQGTGGPSLPVLQQSIEYSHHSVSGYKSFLPEFATDLTKLSEVNFCYLRRFAETEPPQPLRS